MLKVTTQDNKNVYEIYYFHLNYLQDGTFEMVGLARLNVTQTQYVHLAYYKYYRQAITVFAQMDMKATDLIYFRKNKRCYVMPENILNPDVCIQIYGATY